MNSKIHHVCGIPAEEELFTAEGLLAARLLVVTQEGLQVIGLPAVSRGAKSVGAVRTEVVREGNFLLIR